jgi:flagellar biosynthesis protein FlhF
LHLKRFKGERLPDVMRQVRDELGPDAVILQTRKNVGKGMLRFLGGTGVEVLAAVDRIAPIDRVGGPDMAPHTPQTLGHAPGNPGRASDSTVRDRGPDMGPHTPQYSVSAGAAAAGAGGAEMAELRRLLIRLGGGQMLTSPAAALYERLLAAGVDAPLAFDLVEDLGAGDPGVSRGALADLVEERLADVLQTAGAALGPRTATVAVVGPTGSGKTTMLAKLAARSRVAGGTTNVLDLDGTALATTNRLAAVAGILGVPYTLATSAEDLARGLDQPALRGLTLIDTPGLSPRDGEGLAALAALLGRARPSEVHLVLSATSKADDARAAVTAFAAVGVTHLAFTRLDETASIGSLVGVTASAGLPLSYLGVGQEIPNDIRPASARELARRVLRGERTS